MAALALSWGAAIVASAAALPEPGVASSEGTAPEGSDEDAELIRAIQARLGELDLYAGPIDGRPSLTLEFAIRDAQKALGLPEDGLPSEDLLAHLGGITERAEALRQRLDAIRERQSQEARRLLLGSAATRDLVAMPTPGSAMDDVGPSPPCGAAVDLGCVVGPLLETLALIDDTDRRDWVLANLARALTRAGRAEDARRLIARIDDPRTIVTALRDMAVAHAEAGRATAAAAAADIAPAPTTRLEARVGAAAALQALGDRESAASVIAPVVDELDALADDATGIVLLADAAGVVAGLGDAAVAGRLLERAERIARTLATAQDHDLALGTVAQSLAEHGSIARARGLVEAINDPWRRAPLFARVAASAADRGSWLDAEDLVGRVREPRYRAVAEAELAGAYGRAGRVAGGLVMLEAAEASAARVPRGFARSFARSSIAVAASDLGLWDRAAASADAVDDDRLRAETLAKLAADLRAAGVPARADTLDLAASQAAHAIVDPVERAAARAERLVAGDVTERWDTIVAETVAVEDAWQRLRGLTALATIAARVSEAGP